MAYDSTRVPVANSQASIRALLVKYGAQQFTFGEGVEWAGVEFVHEGMLVRMRAPVVVDRADLQARYAKYAQRGAKGFDEWSRESIEQEQKRIWRVIHWSMKARLEAVAERVETFEQAFLAHIVDPATGETLYQRLTPAIDAGRFQVGGVGLKELGSG